MKKIVSFMLLVCMVMTIAACSNAEITMQEIYDASKVEVMLKNHESVHIRNEMDGELWREICLTKDYAYDCIPDEEYPWVQFMTDDACYRCDSGNVLLYSFVTPDGLGDFASERAETYTSVILGEEILDQSIESVSKKDGRITATSALSSKELESWAEDGVTDGKCEYVLDSKTREMISYTSNYNFDEGTVFNVFTEVTYDAEVPEKLKEFLEYMNQTENLRNITVVSNPGADNEESKSIQAPKGLIIGFEYDDESGDVAEFYTDAACTKNYDPYKDTDSDLTISVKWSKHN